MDGKEETDLQDESILFYAVVKNLEIIGEACYMLTLDFIQSHPEINWQDYTKLRHVLVHGYYQINPSIVFEILRHDIPILKEKLREYIKDIDTPSQQL